MVGMWLCAGVSPRLVCKLAIDRTSMSGGRGIRTWTHFLGIHEKVKKDGGLR